MKRLLLLLLLLPGLCCAQVVRVAGGASTIADAQGATVAVYDGDSTTRFGLGYAEGVHLGASREVHVGTSTLTAGDLPLALRLPTDLQDAPRTLPARGVSLETEAPHSGAQIFAGVSGQPYDNAYFSSVRAMRPLLLLSGHTKINDVDVSALHVSGTRSSSFVSAALNLKQSYFVASSAGVSAGKPIVRLAARHATADDRIEFSYTSGQMRLQPEPALGARSLERIGLNVSASRRVSRWLLLDGARHEYSTAEVASDPLWTGVTASRSSLLEGGAALTFGRLHASVRELHATSGALTTNGSVQVVGWSNRTWDVRATAVQSRSSGSVGSGVTGMETYTSRTNLLESMQRLHPRLQLREGVSIGGGSNGIELGGSYEGDRFSLSLGQRELFVPFGNHSGFHQVFVVGFRLRLRDSQVGLDTTTGGTLPSTVAVTMDGYYGQSDGSGFEQRHAPAMPRYAVSGRVMSTTDEPVRGAAVAVGGQVSYTDSEGHFTVRLQRPTPLRVAVEPTAFLTAEQYAAVSEPQTVTPGEDDRQTLQLRVTRCNGCIATETSATPVDSEEPAPKKRWWQRALSVVAASARRMVQLRTPRQEV